MWSPSPNHASYTANTVVPSGAFLPFCNTCATFFCAHPASPTLRTTLRAVNKAMPSVSLLLCLMAFMNEIAAGLADNCFDGSDGTQVGQSCWLCAEHAITGKFGLRVG